MSTENALVAAIGAAAFAGAVLAWKASRVRERLLYLVSLCAYLVILFTVLRLEGASYVADHERAVRTLYLALALGSIPWAALAADLHRVSWRRMGGRVVFVGATAVVGLALTSLVWSDLLFTEINRTDDDRTVVLLGLGGRLLIVYLTAVVAFVLTQVEVFLRATIRLRDRRPRFVVGLVGFSIVVYAYLATETFLYGRFYPSKFVLTSLPATVTCVVVGLVSLRRSVDDMKIPLGRGVVYSSFTLFILGVMMILLGLFARLADLVGVGASRTFLASIVLAASVITLLVWVSPAAKRRLSQFVDENFFVNRHDYRREWERVVRVVRPTASRRELVRMMGGIFHTVFDTPSLYLAVLDPHTGRHRVFDPEGSLVTGFELSSDEDLTRLLQKRHEALLLDERLTDLDLVPAFIDHQDRLGELDVSVLVPFVAADRLVGLALMGQPRFGAAYTPEDLSLMSVIGAELANVVHGHLLLREVEEKRDGEALMRISAFVLHDLKNHVSAIRGMAENAERHMDHPGFRDDLVASLAATADRMSRLMARMSEIRSSADPAIAASAPITVSRVDELVAEALRHAGIEGMDGIDVARELPEKVQVRGDRERLLQVLVNLLRNAAEAMPTGGVLRVSASADGDWTRIEVQDDGCGMDEAFVSDSLFRPFATGKRDGLGIGLYQCRSIIEDHGGEIAVTSRPGEGSRFTVRIPLTEPAKEVACETVS